MRSFSLCAPSERFSIESKRALILSQLSTQMMPLQVHRDTQSAHWRRSAGSSTVNWRHGSITSQRPSSQTWMSQSPPMIHTTVTFEPGILQRNTLSAARACSWLLKVPRLCQCISSKIVRNVFTAAASSSWQRLIFYRKEPIQTGLGCKRKYSNRLGDILCFTDSNSDC